MTKPPNHPYVKLTARQYQILKMMWDESEDLVEAGRDCWVGLEHTNAQVLYALLRYVLVSADTAQGLGGRYYHVNDTGRRYLAGETLIYEVATGGYKTKLVASPPWAMPKES